MNLAFLIPSQIFLPLGQTDLQLQVFLSHLWKWTFDITLYASKNVSYLDILSGDIPLKSVFYFEIIYLHWPIQIVVNGLDFCVYSLSSEYLT